MELEKAFKDAREMLAFINQSPSCFHAVENIKDRLTAKGLIQLKENEVWECEPGKGYFVIRNDSSVIAFRIPAKRKAKKSASAANIEKDAATIKGFHIVAAHSDSPTFKIKEHPEMMLDKNYVRLNTERYGGMILSTWLDRPLSVAGRVVIDKGDFQFETKTVKIDRDLCVIPNVAIHMNRDMNRGVEYNPQVDMMPLFSQKTDSLISTIAAEENIDEKTICGQDLFLYTRQEGVFLGANYEFVMAPRLDDLQCVFAGLRAFEEAQSKDYITVLAVFDNEEVGSLSAQGADSTFMEDTLLRISESLAVSRSTHLQWIANSFLISADNAHAVHPNHPEKSDATNRPYLNGGVVLKRQGAQKYITDAQGSAVIRKLCEKAKVPCQDYANRSDIAGGSTLGNISNSHVSLTGADIGLPQLAMHSAVETAGTLDTYYGICLLKEFYKW